ncbi:unnamed protein product [Lota lota]
MTANIFPYPRCFRFAGGFVCGAAVSTGACIAVLKRYQPDPVEEEPGDTGEQSVHEEIGKFGFPDTGAEVRYYANHVLSYDQAKRTPRWVAEHLTKHKLLGKTDRKHCRFRPDPAIPLLFSAANGDYLHSGWSRGHMAPAGDNKQSERSMAETFYLSNIVPQNYENNAGFWNRLEMYCRDLTSRFHNVWVVSGALALPSEEEEEGGKKTVSYQVIGKDNVAVPTHLFKVILVLNNSPTDLNNNLDQSLSPVPALAAFIVPNQPIGFDRSLTDFQVSLSELESVSGLTFFPKLPTESRTPTVGHIDTRTTTTADNKHEGWRPQASSAAVLPVAADLCMVDGCQLMAFKEFTLYLTGRKVGSARSQEKMDKFMAELKEQGILPDDYLTKLYLRRKEELSNQAPPDTKAGAQ